MSGPADVSPWQHPDPEVGKTQAIRLADIFLLGPAMVAAGATGVVPPLLRIPAVVGGIATVAFNAQNYNRLEESQRGLGGLPGIGTVLLEPPTEMLPVTDPDYWLQDLPDVAPTAGYCIDGTPIPVGEQTSWCSWSDAAKQELAIVKGSQLQTPPPDFYVDPKLMADIGTELALQTPSVRWEPWGLTDYVPPPVPKLTTAKVVGGAAIALLIFAALSRRK